MRWVIYSLIAVLAVAPLATADELVLQDGTRIQWRILEDKGDSYAVETSTGKKMTVGKADVARIEKTPPKSNPLTGATFTFDIKKGADLSNLLKGVDVSRSVAGLWSMEPGPLLITPATPHGRLVIPFEFPVEYDVYVTLQKRKGDNAFYLGLPVGERRMMVVLDGTGGVEGAVEGAPETTFKEKIFKDQKVRVLMYSVRTNRFFLTVDGKTVIDWKSADYTKVSLPEKVDVKNPGLMVGVFDTVYALSGLVVVHPKKKQP